MNGESVQIREESCLRLAVMRKPLLVGNVERSTMPNLPHLAKDLIEDIAKPEYKGFTIICSNMKIFT